MWTKALLILNLLACAWIQNSRAEPIAYSLLELSVKRGTTDYLHFYQDCPLQYAIHFQKRLPERLKTLGIQDARYSSQSIISESCRRRNCELKCEVKVESLSNEFMFQVTSSHPRTGSESHLECKQDLILIEKQMDTIWAKIISPNSNQCFIEKLSIKKF